MNILVAEFAVGAGEGGTILLEGKAMLDVLVRSFTAAGHRVSYPTAGPLVSAGRGIRTTDLDGTIETLARQSDAALVVAPDELLGDLTALVEEHTVNLGCPSRSVRSCADKLASAEILAAGGIQAPRTTTSANTNVFSPGEKVVIKPRWGCASEDTTLVEYNDHMIAEGFVATEYIEGEQVSASLVIGDETFFLTVNRQNITIEDNAIHYDGGTVGIHSVREPQIIETATRTAALLGCRGYVGIDMVLADGIWVIDVNPRPTTSIIGIEKVIEVELGELIVAARFGGLPGSVKVEGEYSFTKADL